MNWITRFQENKQLGHMNSITQERLKKYFGWIDSLIIHIEIWKQMISIGETIKNLVSSEGFSHGTYLKLEDLLNTEFPKEDINIETFRRASEAKKFNK
jgi:hypothetical protein